MTSAKPPRLSVDQIVHCDWSKDASKRWMARGRWNGENYVVEMPKKVGDLGTFFPSIRYGLENRARLLLGFDFPIGIPIAYARRAKVETFLELLPLLETGSWAEFYDVCETPGQISLHRPFYPYRTGGTSPNHLVQRLNLSSRDELFRSCERRRPKSKLSRTSHRSNGRNAACPLFWTLGGKQVGRAAISGWQDLLAPAIRSNLDLGIWPFQGKLLELIAGFSTVIAETYPAEAYGHVGLPRSGWSKRSKPCRRGHAPTIHSWASRSAVLLECELQTLINDGFGPRKDGEDAFDAVVGLLSMIDVVLGIRSEGTPDEQVRGIEGWILGQTV